MSAVIPAYQVAAFVQHLPQKTALQEIQEELHSSITQLGMEDVLSMAALSFQGKPQLVEPANHPAASLILQMDLLSQDPWIPASFRDGTVQALHTRGLVVQGGYRAAEYSLQAVIMHNAMMANNASWMAAAHAVCAVLWQLACMHPERPVPV